MVDVKSRSRLAAEEGRVIRYYDRQYLDQSALADAQFVAREMHDNVHAVAIPMMLDDTELPLDQWELHLEQIARCAVNLRELIRRARGMQTPAMRRRPGRSHG